MTGSPTGKPLFSTGVNPFISSKPMIYEGLHYITEALNADLKQHFQTPDDKATLNAIVGQDGGMPDHTLDRIVLSLVNLEYETNIPYHTRYVPANGVVNKYSLPYIFNADVLVTASFANYNEALKFLSQAIIFFQQKQGYDPSNSPGLDPRIQSLTLEIIRLSYHDAHSLWGALGTNYRPSVLFKIRLFPFLGTPSEVSIIREPQAASQLKHT